MSSDDSAEIDLGLDRQAAMLPCTGPGDADRLVLRHGASIRYCDAKSQWYDWDGMRFVADPGKVRIENRLLATVHRIEHEAKTLDDAEKSYRHRKHAERALSRRHRENVLKDARLNPSIAVEPSEFDADPWLLNVQNGVVDLRTGELLPHSQELLLSRVAPALYDPELSSPTWARFLEQTFGDPEIIDYLQQVLGYALTAATSEQSLWVLLGPGGSGKSTLLNTILGILGRDYGTQAPADLLIKRRGDTHPTVLAMLEGKRLAAVSELNRGATLDKGRVQLLTGGEAVTSRHMRQDYREHPMLAKLFLSTNHFPVLTENDRAIQRRMRVVRCDRVVSEAEQDPSLPAQLASERDGILTWLVTGATSVAAAGTINTPTKVSEDTNRSLALSDPLEGFVHQLCELGDTFEAPTHLLYEAYAAWHEDHGEAPRASLNRFSRTLTDLGIGSRKSGTSIRVGIRLRD